MAQHRRSGSEPRITIAGLSRLYDRSRGAGKVVRLPAPPTAKPLTSDQGDVRLSRLKARADGIRFALQYENQTAEKSKLLRQTLQNLELAIRGMETTPRKP